VKDFKETIDQVFKEQMFMTLRTRLSCKIIRKNGMEEEESYQVLNELVIDRGLSPYLTAIDCFISNKFITQIQADGLIISTPTGSTAYR
jgi:NAD+ kinase